MLFDQNSLPSDALASIEGAFEHSLAEGEAKYWIERCRSGNAQYWRSDDGAYSAITEVLDMKDARIFHMVASCGEFRLALLQEGETWAKKNGCTKSVTEGRPGWSRVLPGYRTTHCTYMKDI